MIDRKGFLASLVALPALAKLLGREPEIPTVSVPFVQEIKNADNLASVTTTSGTADTATYTIHNGLGAEWSYLL